MSETIQVPQQNHPTLNTIASRKTSETCQLHTAITLGSKHPQTKERGVATTLWLQPLCKQNLSLVERYSLQRVIKGISQTYQVLQYSAQQTCILASMLFRNGHEPSYSLPSASKQSRGYCLLREYHQPYEDD